ncbi:hypothetical protein M422DRAFT_28792 [Sphaerobolus stellatus SS14]|nr:hypothetical protein M422DRAFT_28792 [Sphaerobolus stellatus SS14]
MSAATTSNTTAPDLSSLGTSTKPLDTTVGLLLDGYILTMVLYGFIFFQSYVYYNRYPRDHWMFKSAVGILSLMDTAAVASITESLHFYLIVQFLDTFAGVDNARPTYLADNGLAAIAIFISQIGYAHRTWKLKKTPVISLTSAVFATGALILGLIMTARLSTHPSFDLLAENPGKIIMALWQALTFVSAVISFCQLCLWQNTATLTETEKKGWLERSLDLFVGYGVERAGIATIFQLGYLIAFVAAPDKRYWVPFQLISRRLFVVSFITMLNCRHVVRGEGIYDATASIASTAPTAAQSSGRLGSRGVFVTTTTEQFAITSEMARAAASVDGGTPSGNHKVPMVSFDTRTIDEQPPIWINGRAVSQDELDEKDHKDIIADRV